MIGILVLVALALFVLGAVADFICGAGRGQLARQAPYWAAAAGAATAVGAGVMGLGDGASRINLGGILQFAETSVVVDHLSALFLFITLGTSVPVSLVFVSWASSPERTGRRGLGALHNALLAALLLVLVAGDAFLFLFAWEAVTLAMYGLSVFERRKDRASAGFGTLSFGRVGGAMLLVGLLLVAAKTGSLVFSNWAGVVPGPAIDAAYLLLVVGFAVKLGAVPFHLWMPPAYQAAAGPARAAMAGVAANIGVYGLLRTIALLGHPPAWIPVLTLLAGGITALLGVSHAAVNDDLNGAIAYSSVENGGLFLVSIGVALTGASVGSSALLAVGALVAGLHSVTHSLAKSTLFAASARLEDVAGSSSLSRLGGLGRVVPWSGTAFGIGAITLAGLPPTVGFVSEWFLLEALMQQFRISGLALKLAMAVAGALVALTVGFSIIVFVRLIGFMLLRGSRQTSCANLPDSGFPAKVGLCLLSAGCLAIAFLTPLEIRLVARGLEPLVAGQVTGGAVSSSRWVLQPVFSGFSVLSPTWLWIVLPLLILGTAGLTFLFSGRRLMRLRRVPAWRSGIGGEPEENKYTAFGYANPVRHVLAAVLRPRREVQEVAAGGQERLVYFSDVVEATEAYLYKPLSRGLALLSAQARRFQSGRLSSYAAYMLAALVVALVLLSVWR